jgi:hypothetical protein
VQTPHDTSRSIMYSPGKAEVNSIQTTHKILFYTEIVCAINVCIYVSMYLCIPSVVCCSPRLALVESFFATTPYRYMAGCCQLLRISPCKITSPAKLEPAASSMGLSRFAFLHADQQQSNGNSQSPMLIHHPMSPWLRI